MAPQEIRWGILGELYVYHIFIVSSNKRPINAATGGIAKSFAKDLTVDPQLRGNTTIKHTVVAAASSSSAAKAQSFLKDVDAPPTANAYGSYAEFVKDNDVNIVYVATPHSHHYQNTMLCLEAGKNVLCEKAFTVNKAQCEKLVKKAREKVIPPALL